MKHLSRLGLCIAVVAAVASCQSFEGTFSVDSDMDAARMAGPPSGAFNAALQEQYVTIAEREYGESDWEHAGLFARKATAAGNGEGVEPEDPGNWMLSEQSSGQFYAARGQLLLALDNNGRTTAPADAAEAQANFDCWIQETEIRNEGFQEDDIAYCRDRFEAALARVQEAITPEPEPEPVAIIEPAPEPVARDYLVYFDFDKSNIRPDAASILDRVVEAIDETDATSVGLVGHTDTMGPPEYNQILSVKRADSVLEYLQSKGVTAEITATGVGESDPRVPTPDQVEEQENRNVQIRIN